MQLDSSGDGGKLERYLLAMPKAELHVHMEGSISPHMLFRLAEKNKLKLPFSSSRQCKKLYTYNSFQDFANILLLGVSCLRKIEDFYEVILDMGTSMAQQNIQYAEITWTPQFYLNRGYSLNDILGAMNEARRTLLIRSGLEIRWIPDIVRSRPEPASAIATWAVTKEARDAGVVALGLGGPETGYPARNFTSQFRYVQQFGLHANPHAGEGAGAASIWQTIEQLRPSRIGHGVSAIDDEELLMYLVRESLPLEVCPTSNIRLGICKSYDSHPLKRLIDAGCMVTINTDDPVLFQTTLTREYLVAIQECGLAVQDIKNAILNALHFSYLPEFDKSRIIKSFLLKFAELDRLVQHDSQGNQNDASD
jgi:aminodeoxyfutalosine deaminase